MTTDEVRRVKNSQVIKDPFPDHSAWAQMEKSLTAFQRFCQHGLPNMPEPVSIWAAYQKGYEKAYEEMLAAADLVGLSGVKDE